MSGLSMEVGRDLTDEELVLRGKEAQRLLEDPLLVETLDALDAQYVKRWRESQSGEERAILWIKVCVLADIRNELQTYAGRGEFAQAANQ